MPVLTLIRTAPEFPPGSMPAYAKLVQKALANIEGFEVRVCDFYDPAGGGSMRRHHLWRLRHAQSFFHQHLSDLYHLLDGSMAGFLPSKVWEKTVVTVHDLIPLLQLHGRLPGSPGLAGRLLIRRGVHVLRQVAGIASVSEYTARDLLEWTRRSDVTVIHNPVRPLPAPDTLADLPPRYLLHVGNNADYKNRAGVLDVFSRLQDIPDLHLIMAGPDPSTEILKKALSLKRVRFLRNVTDAELSLLYQKASVFLFPSLYEGFGFPVLEAMREGCPVVCSNAASLPEVVGNAARIAPPGDIVALADHCRVLLDESSLRDEQIQRGYQRVKCFSEEQLSASLKDWYLKISGI